MEKADTPFRTAMAFVQENMRKPDMRSDDRVALSALLVEVIRDNAGDPGIRPYKDWAVHCGPSTPDFVIHPSGEASHRLSQGLCAGM